jgi:hypothetical protein
MSYEGDEAEFYKTWLYEITISGGNEPSSASLSELDSDYYWTDNHTLYHAKVPRAGDKYTLYPSTPSFGEHPPGTEFRAPVFTFFDDDDNPVTVYYHHKDQLIELLTIPEGMPPYQALNPGQFGTYEYGNKSTWGINRFEIDGMAEQGENFGHDEKIKAAPTRKVLSQTSSTSGPFMFTGGVFSRLAPGGIGVDRTQNLAEPQSMLHWPG